MFGANPIRKQDLDSEALAVQEIFLTIQGEGPYVGMPAVFVRLAGCNLKCHFCDTDFESNISNIMTVDDIVDKVFAERGTSKASLIVLSGGEPLRQSLVPLINALLDIDVELVFQVETAGTLWDPALNTLLQSFVDITFVCSPKTPKVHPEIMRLCHDWKYIIRHDEVSEEDGLPNKSTQVLGQDAVLYRPNMQAEYITIWVQPCDETYVVGADPDTTKRNIDATVASALKYGYRVSYQTHKALGVR